jgi:hypothetical protein
VNHELAKHLKDAGFPQSGKGATYVDLSSKDSFYVPTLEELLGACAELMKPKEPSPSGLHFFELYPNMNTAAPSGRETLTNSDSGGGKALGDAEEWGVGWSRGPSLNCIRVRDNFFGKSPNEAVARLWLALNAHFADARGIGTIT